MCAALLVAASSAHAAGALSTQSEVMGKDSLGGDIGGAVGPALTVDPQNANRLIATAGNATTGHTNFVVRSGDGGATWNSASSPAYGGGFPPVAVSAGQATLAWGVTSGGTSRAYFGELANPFSGGSVCKNAVSGIYTASSTDGGIVWSTMAPSVVPGINATSVLQTPRLAFDNGTHRLFLAYERVDYSDPTCSGAPTASSIWLTWSNDNGQTFQPPVKVSASATAAAQPSIAVLPTGSVMVAYWNAGAATVAANRCTVTAATPCATPVQVGGAVDPGAVAGVAAHPLPDVAVGRSGSGETRVVVAWTSVSAGITQIRTATSFDDGVSYGLPAVAAPAGANQFNARLAAAPGTANGRVDLAYLQDTGAGTLVRSTSSDTPLSGQAETWSQPVTVQASPTLLASAGGNSPRGWLAVAGSPSSGAPTPLRLAWVDTVTDDPHDPSDIRGVSLLHGSLAPVLSDASVELAPDTPSTIALNATDGDADPLHYSIVTPPEHGSATIPSSVQSDVAFTPEAGFIGVDSMVVQVSDGVHAATATLSLAIGNAPPTIACGSLSTPQDTPLQIDLSGCVTDPNGDTVRIQTSDPQQGSLNGSGTIFTPKPGFVGRGGFDVTAIDGRGALSSAFVAVDVLSTKIVRVEIGQPSVDHRIVAVGQPVAFRAAATDDPNGTRRLVHWTFNDRPGKTYNGSLVTRVFSRRGPVVATATIDGLPPQQVKVTVDLPPLQLLSVKVTRSSVIARVRANVAGTVRMRLGTRRWVTRKVKSGDTLTQRFLIGSAPHLRTMLLEARLAPQKTPALPNPRLLRAVTLPLK